MHVHDIIIMHNLLKVLYGIRNSCVITYTALRIYLCAISMVYYSCSTWSKFTGGMGPGYALHWVLRYSCLLLKIHTLCKYTSRNVRGSSKKQRTALADQILLLNFELNNDYIMGLLWEALVSIQFCFRIFLAYCNW
jgi:hypothetical protein